jgi:hypothetical protein
MKFRTKQAIKSAINLTLHQSREIQSVQSAPVIVIRAAPNVQSWAHCVGAAPRILDLCEALRTDPQKTCCIGVLDDTDSKHHIHSVKLPLRVQQRTSLQDILNSQPGTGFPVKMKYSNLTLPYTRALIQTRCIIALTLANAVVQLHDTPWLGETWSTSDICLLSNTRDSLVAEQPYVSSLFPSTPLVQNKRFRAIKNATIFALGVALLEISHGRQLNTFETPDDLDAQGNRTAWTDYLIADRLVDDVHKRELPNFASAAQRCVHCNFESSVYSLHDDGFRERFYQGVIAPLKKDYDYATSGGG